MLGLLVILIISWGMLYLFESKNLSVLGFYPLKERSIQLTLGFGLMAGIILVAVAIETLVLKVEWQTNSLHIPDLMSSFWYHLKSALTEDLIFRGAILYILIRRITAKWAILLSAILFGCYHWFSYGILNERPILLAYIFVVTGLTGWVWAWCFNKTGSVILGLGLHLGYNFMMSLFYESQPYGQLLFTQLSQTELIGWGEFFYSMFRGLFPSLATLLGLHIIFKQKRFCGFRTNSDEFVH